MNIITYKYEKNKSKADSAYMKKIKSKKNKYAQDNSSRSSLFAIGNMFNLNRSLSAFNPNIKYLFLFSILSAVLSMAYSLIVVKLSVDAASTVAVLNAAVFFFSYLIARELEPDRSKGAFIAGVLALIFSSIWGLGNIVVLFWMLMLLRMLSRTCGQGPGLIDNLLIIAATYWIVRDGQWGYAVLTVLACAFDSQLPNGSGRSLYTAGFAFVIAAFSPKVPYEVSSVHADMFAVIIVATVLFLPIIKLAEHTKSLDDYARQPLATLRLQFAGIFTILASFGMIWFYGQNVIQSFMPIWAAVLGTGIYLPIALINGKKTQG